MDTLPLHPLHSLLPLDLPFTPAMAREVGIQRSALDRMVRDGLVLRVLRGVYAARGASSSLGFRAAAVGMAMSRRGIVVDRTAAWVHGLVLEDGLPPLDVLPLEGTRHS